MTFKMASKPGERTHQVRWENSLTMGELRIFPIHRLELKFLFVDVTAFQLFSSALPHVVLQALDVIQLQCF
jgi:hypothetical protein